MRWRVVLAIAMGTWLALWLLRGDARPEARETNGTAIKVVARQPMWQALGPVGSVASVTEITVAITRFHVIDGVEYYRLYDGQGDAVLAVDKDLPIAAWLRAHGKATLR